MKRRLLWFLLPLLACLPILLAHSVSDGLLQDSDTAFLLKVIRERQAPFGWFIRDWPLQNHFYRPLPTLTFELDSRLYGNNPVGYGWTNCILCALCVLALFWLLAELSTSPVWAFAGAAVFALWNLDRGSLLATPLTWAAGLLVIAGMYRHGLQFRRYVPACLILLFLASELLLPQVTASRTLGDSMISWLPGRTASVMTIFALCALAAYVRYERARNRLLPQALASATDRPTATRSGVAIIPKRRMLWLVLSLLGVAGAFASYEQAVMLPAALLGIAIYLRVTGRRPNWTVHIWFWALLVGYLVLRHAAIPSGISGYQAQQFRHGSGVWYDLAGYGLPGITSLIFLWAALGEGVVAILNATAFGQLLNLGAMVTSYVQARRKWQPILAGWALSLIAFLPMAWVKQFGHYHYWPLALRTIYILGLGKLAWDMASIAVCPPELQAPPRPSPAPGSLPRP